MKTVIQYAVLMTLIQALFTTTHAAEPDPDKWQFTITPYLWVATIKGDTSADGVDSGIDTGYTFLSLDNLEGAFFITASASKGQWTLQTDLVYLNFADAFTLGPIDTTIDLKGDVVELSAAYKLQSYEHTEVLFGVRRVSLDFEITLTPGPQVDSGATWTDPIVGFRYVRPLGERWDALVRADVGGFSFSSDLTFNAVLGAGFSMTKHSSLFLGYRYLKLKFKEDDLLADLTAEGFAIGVEFNF